MESTWRAISWWLLGTMMSTTTQAGYFALNYTPTARCDLPIRPSTEIPPTNEKQYGRSRFTQPLDHARPDLGTFEVNYYWNRTHWAGPGSPIVVFLPGETHADRHLVHSRPDFSLVGVLAEHLGAAVLVPEHRYYGGSSPFSHLTTSNLTYLTVENALLDVVRLAKRFSPPWTNATVGSTARDVPWILVGGSYSAAQTAWIANIHGGTYWAYLALSPIVQSITSYWQYYLPQVEYGRGLCTALLDSVIGFIDDVFGTGRETQIRAIKTMFGLDGMDDDSFLFHITSPILFWSEQDVGRPSRHYDWLCNRVQGTHASALNLIPPDILALLKSSDDDDDNVRKRGDWSSENLRTLKALYSYSEGFRQEIAPMLCSGAYCVNETDPLDPRYSELSVQNRINRQYAWLQCNDLVGGYIVGAPPRELSLVSRLTTADFFARQCALFFPPGSHGETYGANRGRTAAILNAYTGGWSPTRARRIIYSSGSRDVWREMGVTARLRPGGPMQSDPQKEIVVHVVETGFHHSELSSRNAELYEEVRRVRDLEVEQVCRWVQQWPGYL
ncbi:serine peptidase like protein [Zymoseptoria brevis]|uniref:Serine peptidase like protein n=1 Tax=Zymoseptoria brevis TaxID=1047168 RepID=A0A0F4GGN1_9PEZI|nr:serine peptidase like protein [Zymoseptoria brevis]